MAFAIGVPALASNFLYRTEASSVFGVSVVRSVMADFNAAFSFASSASISSVNSSAVLMACAVHGKDLPQLWQYRAAHKS